jgi:hypothetical protein
LTLARKAPQLPEEDHNGTQQTQNESNRKTKPIPQHSKNPMDRVRGSQVKKKQYTHQPINPYNLVVFDSFKNLNAESPSKKCVSGTRLAPASRLSHPLLAISVFKVLF